LRFMPSVNVVIFKAGLRKMTSSVCRKAIKGGRQFQSLSVTLQCLEFIF
jgi:hypothetical protein